MVANQAAANKVSKARSGAMAAERIRQGGLQQEADALNLASQDRYKGFEDKQDDKSASLGAYFNNENQPLPQGTAANGAPAETMPTGSANNVVTQEIAKQKGKATAYGTQQGAALGNLRSFGDLLADNSRGQARDAGQIGQIGGMMRGSSAVLPLELEHANAAGNGMATFGQILGGAGQLGMAAGINGGAADQLFGTKATAQMVGPLQPGVSRPMIPTGGAVKGSGNIFSLFGS